MDKVTTLVIITNSDGSRTTLSVPEEEYLDALVCWDCYDNWISGDVEIQGIYRVIGDDDTDHCKFPKHEQ